MKAPEWCNTPELSEHWRKPWGVPLSASKARKFKRRLWKHGYLSPNFTRQEAASKDGRAIPRRLRKQAQRHAFHLERCRHAQGDHPLGFLSWYRSRAHNAAVGGVPGSQHTKARATDPGGSIKRQTAEVVFANGAIGYDNPRDMNVAHVDSRPGGPVRYFYNS